MPKIFVHSKKNLIPSQLSNVSSTDLFINNYLDGEKPILSATPSIINLPSDGTPAVVNFNTENSNYFNGVAKNVADIEWEWEIDGVTKNDTELGYNPSFDFSVVGRHNIRMRVKEGNVIGLWSDFISIIVESSIQISTPTIMDLNNIDENGEFKRYEYDEHNTPEISVYVGDDNTINLELEDISDSKTDYIRWNIFDIGNAAVTTTLDSPDSNTIIDHNDVQLTNIKNEISGNLDQNDKFITYNKTNTQLTISVSPSSLTDLQPISSEPIVKNVSVIAYNADGTSSLENKIIFKFYNPRVQNPFVGWRPKIGSSFFNSGNTIYSDTTNVDLYLDNTQELPDTVITPTYTWELGDDGYIVGGHGLNQITARWEYPGTKTINLKMEQDSYCVHTKFVECDTNNPHANPDIYEQTLTVTPKNPFGSWTPLINIETMTKNYVDGQEITISLDGSFPETVNNTSTITWEVVDKNDNDSVLTEGTDYTSDLNNNKFKITFNTIGLFGIKLKVEQDGYDVNSNEVILEVLSNIVNFTPVLTHGTTNSLDGLPLYITHQDITGLNITTPPGDLNNYYFCYYISMNPVPPSTLSQFEHVPGSKVTEINTSGFPEMGVITPGRYFIHFFFTMDNDKNNLVRNSQISSSEYMVEYNLSKLTENGFLDIEVVNASDAFYYYNDEIHLSPKIKAGLEALGIRPDHIIYEWDKPTNSIYIENTTDISEEIKIKVNS